MFKSINFILCGDFNSVPNSGIYKMITTGELNCYKLERRAISNQLNGNISYIIPKKLKPTLLNLVTAKYDENKPSVRSNEHAKWVKDIVSICPNIKNNKLLLEKNSDITFEANYKLTLPFSLNSAYAENVKNMFKFLSTKNYQEHPYDLITNYVKYEKLEMNGILMGLKDINKTINFTKNMTLEPPISCYNKNIISTVDYIFYSGNMEVLRTLNIPDLNYIAQDLGPMPNELYPSDHLSLAADFLIK